MRVGIAMPQSVAAGESADGGAYLLCRRDAPYAGVALDQTTATRSATLLLLASRWRLGNDRDQTALEGRKKFHGQGRTIKSSLTASRRPSDRLK